MVNTKLFDNLLIAGGCIYNIVIKGKFRTLKIISQLVLLIVNSLAFGEFKLLLCGVVMRLIMHVCGGGGRCFAVLGMSSV